MSLLPQRAEKQTCEPQESNTASFSGSKKQNAAVRTHRVGEHIQGGVLAVYHRHLGCLGC